MNIKSTISVLIISLVFSCNAKKSAYTQESLVTEINNYAASVDTNSNLKREVTEGALTDDSGFKDIGTFKYTVYFDEKTKELYKIENIEKTESTTTELYNFKNQKLVRIKSVTGTKTKKIYLKKERVISEDNTTSEDQQLLIEKANRFQKAFEKTHK